MVHVMDVECIFVQGTNSRPLVDVDVRYPELLALLQVTLGPVIVQLPALRVLVPLGGVELYTLEAKSLVLILEFSKALLAQPRLERAVEDELVRILLRQHRVLGRGVEPVW